MRPISGLKDYMTRIFTSSFLRRSLLLAMLLPLAACGAPKASPWENMNYDAAIHFNADDSI